MGCAALWFKVELGGRMRWGRLDRGKKSVDDGYENIRARLLLVFNCEGGPRESGSE
jgi:hypothetical protein